MSLTWYIQRIKTFSPEEVLFRVRQRIRTHILDKRILKKKAVAPLPLPESEIVNDTALHLDYPIFEKSVDVFKSVDWRLDVQSGKRFPLAFAHGIDIRSDKFGSAKHVWEVNRQLFLTHIASLYKRTGERRYLELVMFHLTSWKNANPYMVGVNWYSNIEVNIRLINWAFCWDLLSAESLQKTDETFAAFVQNVWMPLIFEHAEYSYLHPSLYSSANNHLISEYAGLFVAACKWNLPHREKRLAYAKEGLEREILLQNTTEGVNREEAAEYIQFIDDFFLIAALVGDSCKHPFSESYKERLHEMARYMNAFVDCGWNYPMYGDGDDGFVLRPDAGGHFNNFKSLLTSFAVYFEDADLKREGAVWDEKNQLLFDEAGRAVFSSLPAASGETLDGNKFFCESGHFIFRKEERVAAASVGAAAVEIAGSTVAVDENAAVAAEVSADGAVVAESTAAVAAENAAVAKGPAAVAESTAAVHAERAAVRETYLHFDAAPLGFLSIAAHGHADALSFILHVDGHPVIVDPGTFTYHTHKDLRRYFVATSSHNTVCVNGKNQATQAGPTMWLNHYKCRTLDVGENFVEATHDGYRSEGVEHKRKVVYNRENDEFVVSDTLTSPNGASVEIPFHLHPSANVFKVDNGSFKISVPGARSVLLTPDSKLEYVVARGEENPVAGWYSEHFGEKVESSVLYAKMQIQDAAVFETKIRIL